MEFHPHKEKEKNTHKSAITMTSVVFDMLLRLVNKNLLIILNMLPACKQGRMELCQD